MPHSSGGHSSSIIFGGGKLIPPRGFKAELYPLEHKVKFAFALSAGTETGNSTIATLVKNYKGSDNPDTVNVNPHHPSFVKDKGAICAPMSIIDKLKLRIQFTFTRQSKSTDEMTALKFHWFPIFFSFPEKLDSADDKTTTTLASLLELVKDATQEDVTPLWSTTNLPIDGGSDLLHPLSTVNLAEVATTHTNLTTDAVMESVALDWDALMDGKRYYTNKGAINASMGKIRTVVLSSNRTFHNVFINKFVPRSIRRIMPYSYFAICVHCPLDSDINQIYHTSTMSVSKPNLGVKILALYHEWNSDHLQEMM